jgi:very-short-patch-repair endonuclease
MRTTRTPLTGVARILRHRSTDAEQRLWYRVRNRQLDGHKFRRQMAIGCYIVDFVCVERRLVIELDGGQHVEQAAHDAERTLFLMAQGFKVVRFWNDEVLTKLEDVLAVIHRELEHRPSP